MGRRGVAAATAVEGVAIYLNLPFNLSRCLGSNFFRFFLFFSYFYSSCWAISFLSWCREWRYLCFCCNRNQLIIYHLNSPPLVIMSLFTHCRGAHEGHRRKVEGLSRVAQGVSWWRANELSLASSLTLSIPIGDGIGSRQEASRGIESRSLRIVESDWH